MSDLARAIPGLNGAIVCDRALSNSLKVKSLDCSGGSSYPPARVGRFPTKTPSPFVRAYDGIPSIAAALLFLGPTPCWGAGPLPLGQGRGSPLPLRRAPPGGAERPPRGRSNQGF